MGMTISFKEWELHFKTSCAPKDKKTWLLMFGACIWAPISTFGAWGIGDFWKLDKEGYNSSRTPSCGIILDMKHGAHDKFQGGRNYVKVDHITKS